MQRCLAHCGLWHRRSFIHVELCYLFNAKVGVAGGVALLFTLGFDFLPGWIIENAAMDLKDILENFIKYKEQLDDLDRNGSESNSVETYEKQFMVCLTICSRVFSSSSSAINQSINQ